jgi:hypothetical protein
MTRRYKSRPSGKTIARSIHCGNSRATRWPWQRLNAMHAFHDQRGIQVVRIRHRHEGDRDHLLWCFARRAIAEEFAATFGGALMG